MCRMEGEIKLSFLGSMRLLQFLKDKHLVNRYGYLCNRGVPVSQDDMPHYRTRGRKLTIPDSDYPDEFYDLLKGLKWTGWLIVSRPGDEWMDIWVSGSKQRLNTRHLWEWILETRTYVLHRSIETEEYSIERGAELGHNIAKMLIVQSLVPHLDEEQATQEMKNRREISSRLQRLLIQ